MFKRIIKSLLKKRGLALYPYSSYKEGLEPVKYDWIKRLNPDLVFDVGASDGGFARKIHQILPNAEIHSFEILPMPFAALQKAFEDNKLFHAYNIALSNKKGQSVFYQNEYSGSSSLLKMGALHKEAYPFTANETEIIVLTDTLDNVFQPESYVDKTILLKMDVQGGEGLVLEGGLKLIESVDLIQTEVNFVELYEGCIHFNDMCRRLDELGFDVYGFENISQSLKDGSYLQADAFFIRRDTAKKILSKVDGNN